MSVATNALPLTLPEKLRPQGSALLVIDMQNDFCAAGGYIETVIKKPVDAAARIMAHADGEQILVSDVLKSILGAAKDLGFKDHKRVRLKGFAERWRLWEVTWRSESQAIASDIATGVASGAGRTPFVGRAEERSLLRQAMSRAIAGGGGQSDQPIRPAPDAPRVRPPDRYRR